MKIALIEPFFTGSHKRWAQELVQQSSHEIKIFSLPGRHWKWRMYGGAVTLAKELLNSQFDPDLILATDMLDLATFCALTKSKLKNTKTALYFHENQLTYPWSKKDRDVKSKNHLQYAYINFTSCLVADRVFFNSQYHKNIFLDSLPSFLKSFPDCDESNQVDEIRKKSSTLPLGFNGIKEIPIKQKSQTPLILWNHRWEYDKNPQEFFETLFYLKEEGIKFKLAILGESFEVIPDIFLKAKERLTEEIIHFGFAKKEQYEMLMQRAHILPVTSHHDFFGLSVVEAISYGLYPLLPYRLAYPEHILEKHQNKYFYTEQNDLYQKLKHICLNYSAPDQEMIDYVNRYDWKNMIKKYDQFFELI